ncbi:MAG: MFS transporter [Isosphaeraceae bacterium]
MSTTRDDATRWYAGVTRAQWLVLAIASAGWVFDTFEGQVFNITRGQMLADLLGTEGGPGEVRRWGDVFLAIFLAGGTAGGVLFGTLADRFGRKPIMAVTILVYSLFSGLTFFATELWHVAVLRFLVALGVGGEWSVAAALVAEVFPTRARAHASGIFHATSVLGTWMAAIAGLLVGAQWRYAYVVGVAPALLVLWVRSGIREPERWRQAEAGAEAGSRKLGSFRELFGDPRWARPALLGLALAAVGMGTFWGVTVAGQDLALDLLLRSGVPRDVAAERAKFAFGVVQTAGAGLGLLSFGPLAEWLGRRRAFALMHLLSLVIVPVTCYAPRTYEQLLALLPVFGFCTLSIHAGYAVYFPELFPDHLRATGSGVCFNGGRLAAAPILIFSGQLKALPGMDLRLAMTWLGTLFLGGLVILWFLPETRGRALPEA